MHHGPRNHQPGRGHPARGLRTRVIPPGGGVTLDHDPMRLNIEVDEAGTIRRMRCG